MMTAYQKTHLLIIFDLVSTLTDAGPRYARAFQDVCAENGINPPAAEDVLAHLGNKNLKEITALFAPALPEGAAQTFMDSCNHACDALLNRPDWHETLFPNVQEAVETLALRGVALGIFTGTREDAMQQQLDYHGIGDFFPARYRRGKDNARDGDKTSDELKAEQIAAIVQQFKKDKTGKDGAEPVVAVVVIGDSAADAQAAARLGLHFVGFAADAHKRQKLEAAGVAECLTDFGQLPDLAQRLMSPPANDDGPRQKPEPAQKSRPEIRAESRNPPPKP